MIGANDERASQKILALFEDWGGKSVELADIDWRFTHSWTEFFAKISNWVSSVHKNSPNPRPRGVSFKLKRLVKIGKCKDRSLRHGGLEIDECRSSEGTPMEGILAQQIGQR